LIDTLIGTEGRRTGWLWAICFGCRDSGDGNQGHLFTSEQEWLRSDRPGNEGDLFIASAKSHSSIPANLIGRNTDTNVLPSAADPISG
jgi:hypothetical protein